MGSRAGVVLLLGVLAAAPARGGDLATRGFFDFEVSARTRDRDGGRWSFDQHHLNLLGEYSLDERFRVLTELEWEHGPTQSSGEILGKIYLARAVLEWRGGDAIRLQAGKFLTPFGIYNERHDATPTFLSTLLPYSVYGGHPNAAGKSERHFAKTATGLQAYGAASLGAWHGSWHAYVVNGRGADPYKADDNNDKGSGGRLSITDPSRRATMGVSVYSDRNGQAGGARETSAGADLAWDLFPLGLEAEAIAVRLGRLDEEGDLTGRSRTALGGYLQAGLAVTPRLTPFARLDLYDPDDTAKATGERDLVGGVNYAASSQVFLKVEAHILRFDAPGLEDHEQWVGSVAVAF